MSTRSKIVYLFVVLLFAVSTLAGAAFSAVQSAAHDLHQSDSAFHIDGSLGAPAYSIAGECDMAPACGGGSG